MSSDLDDALGSVRRDPATTGIFTDFDGTLSPIVEDPATAVPVAGARELLDELAQHYQVVAVISGRPVSFLVPQVPPSVLVVGLYGLEMQREGQLQVDPSAERWRPVVAEAATRCEAAGVAGLVVEPKGLSLTLHYRSNPRIESRVVALATDVASTTGLVQRAARQSVELHPPIDADKGTVIRSLAGDLRAVCYLGDDRGDLAAFEALDELASQHVDAVKIAVRSDEAPAELLKAADVTVEGPAGAAALLRTLLHAARGSNARS